MVTGLEVLNTIASMIATIIMWEFGKFIHKEMKYKNDVVHAISEGGGK